MPSRLHQLRLLNDQKLIVCVWAFKLNFFISKYLDFVNDFWKWIAFNSNFSYKIIILHFPYDSLVHFGLDTLENAPYRFLYFLHLLFLTLFIVRSLWLDFIRRQKPWIRFHRREHAVDESHKNFKFNFNYFHDFHEIKFIFDGNDFNEVIKSFLDTFIFFSSTCK